MPRTRYCVTHGRFLSVMGRVVRGHYCWALGGGKGRRALSNNGSLGMPIRCLSGVRLNIGVEILTSFDWVAFWIIEFRLVVLWMFSTAILNVTVA